MEFERDNSAMKMHMLFDKDSKLVEQFRLEVGAQPRSSIIGKDNSTYMFWHEDSMGRLCYKVKAPDQQRRVKPETAIYGKEIG